MPIAATPPPVSTHRLSASDVHLHQFCDELTQILLFGMVIFSPWAFGTTQPWSIWTMTIAGYALGALLAVKLLLRNWRGYKPHRWTPSPLEKSAGTGLSSRFGPTLDHPTILAGLTVAVLVYCLVSAINPRATFHNDTLAFEYHDCVSWLPHSFDRDATWFCFWNCLGVACAFWATRDWLLGKSAAEERAGWHKATPVSADPRPHLPARLRRLLWVLALNGAVLAIEGIFQRAEGSSKLLFLVQPRIHQTALEQFGPYAYRSNAAQYFNLLWPVCLGFWWSLNRSSAGRGKSHRLLLGAAAVMAACPILSASRAGAMVTLLMMLAAGVLFGAMHLLTQHRRRSGSAHSRALVLVTFSLVVALVLGLGLGWRALGPRMAQLTDGFAGREQMNEVGRLIAQDFPWFGTGPGTFETVSQLYPRPDISWPPQLHNDWLETRITFGWLGSGLIALALACILLRWFRPGGIHGGRHLWLLLLLGLAGCLVHARYDFPFQIHSILFLFVLLCSVLSTFSCVRGSAVRPG